MLMFAFTAAAIPPDILVLGIPRAQTTVKADGAIDNREWGFSARLPYLHFMECWEEMDFLTSVWAQYDDQNLYLAFQIRRPPGNEKPQVIPPDETQYFAEDRVRILLQWKDGKKTEMIGNARELKDATGKRCDWQYAVKLTSAGWQGEIAIPLPFFKEKEVYFDFINDQATPGARVTCLGYRTTMKEPDVLWKLTTRENLVIQSFLPERTQKSNGRALYYRYINNEENETKAAASFRIIRIDGPLEKNLNELWQRIEKVKFNTREESIGAYGRPESRFKLGAETGRYLIQYLFRDEHGVLAQGILFVKNQIPFEVTCIPYLLTRRIFELEMKMEQPPMGGEIEIELYESGNRKEIITKGKKAVNGEGSIVAEISSAACKPKTNYILEVKLKNASGKTLAEKTIDFYRPENPSWHDNRIGKSVFVPPPWKALEYSNGRIKVWGRETTLGKGLLPEKIISRERELLTGPIELNLKINGASVELKEMQPRIIEQNEEGITLSCAQTGAGYAIKVVLRAEFDGYLWYEVEIDPVGQLTLDEAWLRIPMKSGLAGLFHVEGEGTLRKERKSFLDASPQGKTPVEQFFPFCSFVWLGNQEVGLQYFCETAQNWNLKNEEEALEIARGEKQTELKVSFVNQAKAVREKVIYGFGLMASPVKPMGKRHQFWSATGIVCQERDKDGKAAAMFAPEESLDAFEERVIKPWAGPPGPRQILSAQSYRDTKVRLSAFRGWSPFFGIPFAEDELFNEKFKRFVQTTKEIAPDIKLTPYTGWGINKNLSFWTPFGREMTRRPFEESGWDTVLHCANSSFTDYFVDALQQALTKYGVDGFYLDSTAVVPCCNRTGHGCGYVDAKGILHGTYPIRAFREFFKRMYKVTHGEVVKDGIIFLHGDFRLPVTAFSDVLLTAEPGVALWQDLEGIGLENFQATCMGEPYGFKTLICWHYFSPNLKIKTNQMVGYALLHGETIANSPIGLLNYKNGHQDPGYDKDKFPLRHIYLMMDEFCSEESPAFYPYWNNGEFLKTGRQDLLGSFYVNSRGEALLILCNLKNETGRAKINFKLPSGQIREVSDGFLKTTVPINKDGEMEIEFCPQGYRLLRIK